MSQVIFHITFRKFVELDSELWFTEMLLSYFVKNVSGSNRQKKKKKNSASAKKIDK